MKCPNPECEGKLIITRVLSTFLGARGEIPIESVDELEDYLVCDECTEMPSFSWVENRVVLEGENSD